MKKKIAIFGGAFNPITKGHAEVAQFVLNTNAFDEVWLTPCYKHVYGKEMVSAEHRLEMCRLAIKDKRIKIFDYEITNQFTGETYHLVEKLLKEDLVQMYDFSLVIGQDNANTFDKWFEYKKLEQMIRFVVVPRNGIVLDPKVTWYLKSPHINLNTEVPMVQISSTEVRRLLNLSNLDEAKRYLEEEVFDYICQHKLYLN